MPDYNDDARLDTSQVSDRRGRGLPMAIGGGGGIGLIILIVSVLLGGPIDLSSVTSPATDQPSGGALGQECQTGADAERREDCRIVLFVNSIQEYWGGEFTRRGSRYQMAQTQIFTQATQTGCGQASSQVGPFYCPVDQGVYLDLGFFEELSARFGAKGGDFAQAYVLAHEYGHHIQNLIGTLERSHQGGSGPDSGAVRVELQADCLAGVWAHNATSTGFINSISEADIATSLDAAAAVGDDRIQEKATGRVNPEQWTHGSAQQRQQWFNTGYRSGNMDNCDTFRGAL